MIKFNKKYLGKHQIYFFDKTFNGNPQQNGCAERLERLERLNPPPKKMFNH